MNLSPTLGPEVLDSNTPRHVPQWLRDAHQLVKDEEAARREAMSVVVEEES